jgi:hypothetical protein
MSARKLGGGAKSGGPVGKKDGDAIDDGIAAATAGTTDGGRIQCERLMADWADQPLEIGWLERVRRICGHKVRSQFR